MIESTFKIPNSKAIPIGYPITSPYCEEAKTLFTKMNSVGGTVSESRKVLIDNTIKRWKLNGEWDNKDFIYVWTCHNQQASLIDWKNPNSRRATVVGGMTFTVDSNWKSNGSTGRIELNYNPTEGLSNFTQNNNSFGVYTFDRVVENRVELSAQNDSSIGNDLFLTVNISSKNNSGTSRSVNVLTGFGLNSCQRVANKSWQNYRNGYWLYAGGSPETDISNPIPNVSWVEFCRKVGTTYSAFSTKKHAMSYAGSSCNQFLFSSIFEEEFLVPLGLAPTKRISFNGNSFTSAAVYITQALSDLGTYYYDVNSVGITGQTTPEMELNAITTIFPFKKKYLTKDIFFIWELTNDMVDTGSNATTCYDNMVSYCRRLRNSIPNAYIIVATMLPRTAPVVEANRQNDANLTDASTLNGMIRNNADGAWDAVCDIASDLNMGQSGQYSDLTYYSADGVHPNTTGYKYIGTNYVYPSINAVL